jgi:Golgi phosphoprotein 3 (GPP34)
VAGLSGTGRLADDLYLLGHSDISGKPFLQPRATGIGLAGALLAELMLSGHIHVEPEGIAVARSAPPADRLAHHILDVVTGEAEDHPVREWLLYIGRTAAEDVARRLDARATRLRPGSRPSGDSIGVTGARRHDDRLARPGHRVLRRRG